MEISLAMDISRKCDEDSLINGLKREDDDYYDQDHTNIHLQMVPEIHKEEGKSKHELLVVVPDEHSETDDYHHSDHRRYSRNKHDKRKRRRIQTSDDEESRKVPSLARNGFKRKRNEMCEKMRTLKKLVPNCHKKDKVISILDNAIEYMKSLQLQLQLMSIMGMNSYFPPATLDFGMHNHLLTAMDVAHVMNLANGTSLSPVSNWSLPHSLASSPLEHGSWIGSLLPMFPGFFYPYYGMTMTYK